MKTFQILAASAALAAYVQAAPGVWSDCATFEVDLYGLEADCLLDEAFAQNMVETDKYSYAAIPAQNAEGYNLNLFRLVSDDIGGGPANRGELGPIVLVHGEDGSALSWFTQDDTL